MSDFYEEAVTGSVSSDQMSGKIDGGSSHGSIIYPYESFDAFPEKGRRNALYIDTSQIPNKLYRWDVNSSSYVPIGDGDSDGEVPETLPNPHALSFTGAVKTAYDGSRPVSVNIPSSESIDHSKLQNRGATNQHPISAIAGLSPILESLEDELSEVKGQISSPFNFKGSIDSSELPETAEVNDTYYCTDLKYRVTWNGSEWAQSSSPEAEFTDELIDARKGADGVTYTTAGGAVRGQLQGAHKDIANTSKYADFIAKYGSDHFYPIVTSSSHPVTRWEQPGTEITAFSPVAGTDYIKCPKYLCIDFPDDVSRCYLYFYKLIDGEFVANWDLLSFTTGAKVLNYIRNGIVESNMIEIPDDMYMQIAVVVGEVNFYGWDGMPSGVPLSADVSIPVSASSQADYEYTFAADGSFGVAVPGNAKYFACANGSHFAMGIAVNNGAVTVINTAKKNFISLPEGYDYFNFRVFCNDGECITGDVSNVAIAITPEAVESRRASAHAKEVLALCEKVNSLPWAVMSELPAYLFNDVENSIITSTSKGAAYKTGIKYNGLPYCSNWDIAHYVGWHVSPHTFLNAVNDPDSIFYKERVLSWDKKQESVYYGTVCSAFGTMVNGWNYPQTNAGFIYDPDIDVTEEKTPPIGSLYSNLVDHCLIPQRVDVFKDGRSAITAYEGVKPMSMRTTRYNNIDIDSDISGFNSYYGNGYYDNYGYAISYKKANGNVPYADFDDTAIVGGSARPYKGDRSVYTNNEPVLVNIKNGSILTITKDGNSQTIDVTGLTQIDVTEYLDGDGIYFVSTDADNIEESFEYHEVEPITYDIKNGRILFSSADFWYASCYLEGFPLFTEADGKLQAKVCCVPSREDNNYRDWMKEGYFTSATVAFRKGEYGAYVIPLELGDVEDIIPDDSTGGTYDYDLLYNKPKINGVILEGNISSDVLGIVGSGGVGINLLHNADWAYSLVNQRGHSGAVSDAYCIDRWIGNGNVTPVNGKYVTLAKGTTMTQRMEYVPESIVGKMCTFSIDVDGTAESATIAFPATVDGAANTAALSNCTLEVGLISGSFTLCDVTCLYVPYIKITVTADINVRRVFLELGEMSHMTETTQKDIVLDALTCQRYCKVLGQYAMYRASVVSKNGVLTTLPIAVQMRTTPSIESGSFLMRTLANADIDGFNFSIGASGTDFIRIDATKTSHGLTDAALRMGTAIVISADL